MTWPGFKPDLRQPDPDCPWCRGEGVVDSGGFTPWDEGIEVACGCLHVPATNTTP